MHNITNGLFEKYGPLLSTTDLAEVFKYKNSKAVQEAIYRETFPDAESPLAVKRLGKRICANYIDVANYIKSHFNED